MVTIEDMIASDIAFGTVRAAIVKLDDSELKEWLLERLLIMEDEHIQHHKAIESRVGEWRDEKWG